MTSRPGVLVRTSPTRFAWGTAPSLRAWQSAAMRDYLIGEIVQANVFGKIRFDLVANGHLVGTIQAENWRAWDFAVVDAAGTEVARITKRWEGLARTLFTTADKYVVHVHFRLPEPLASMVVASALTRGDNPDCPPGQVWSDAHNHCH